KFQGTLVSAFALGLFVSLFFLLKFRETRAESALHRAEAERHQLSKLALESELKLMQAQVEPHFLFNTLASVQYLTETESRAECGRARAAVPVQHACFGPIPHRNRSAAGVEAARAPARVSSRCVAAASQREGDTGSGTRSGGGRSQSPSDTHGRAGA